MLRTLTHLKGKKTFVFSLPRLACSPLSVSCFVSLSTVPSGRVFLDFKGEVLDVYKIYCQNHDDAISLLESYEKDENIQRHVLECLDRLR